MANQQLLCPKCGQIDMVQKVSAVYSAGISSGNFHGNSVGGAISADGRTAVTGSTTNLKGVSQTNLSKRLTPPSKPTYSDNSSMSGYMFLLVSVCFILTGAWISLQNLTLTALALCSPIGLLFAIVGVVGLYESNAYNKRMKPIAEADIATWQRAMRRWNELYYCSRDDIVFDPTSGLSAPCSQMNSLLHQQTETQIVIAHQ